MARALTDIELKVQALEDELIRRGLDNVLKTLEWAELKQQASGDGAELEYRRSIDWGDDDI